MGLIEGGDSLLQCSPMSTQPSIPMGWINLVPDCKVGVGAERVYLYALGGNTA